MSRESRQYSQKAWLFPAAIVVAAVLLWMPLPGFLDRSHSHIVGEIHDLTHFPIFTALACLACRYFLASRAAHYASILLCVVLFAALMEIGQAVFGARDPSWADMVTNTLGAASGIALWIAVRARGKPHAIRTMAFAAAVALASAVVATIPSIDPIRIQFAQASAFPVLYKGGFPGTAILAESLGDLDHVELEVSGDALHVDLLHPEPVGIVLWRFRPDWTGFDALAIDIENTRAADLPMQIDVRDYASSNEATDFYSSTFTLRGNERRLVVIDLDEIAAGPTDRALDLGDVSLIALYRIAAGSDGFAVHEARLE